MVTAEQIERIVAMVPGGAPNIADIYPLAPLQEGILFHHLLAKDGDPYVLRTMLRFESRARVDAFVLALQAVIARHDILRTAVLWEGLSEPVQVVLRTALLVVEEVALDPSAGEVSQQLASRFDPRHYRLDVRQAPLLRVAIAPEVRPGHWSMALLLHHLVCDHTTLEIVLQEVEAHLTGRAAQLPVPLPFRNVVAQARLGVSRAEHEAFFTELLGDVDEPTVPFGLREVHGDGSEIAEARRALDPALAQRLRARARALGVSAASICHLAWARVLGAVSGREDVVFGTVVFGRMQGGEGADRVLGLFINTLPVRIAVGDAGVQESVRQTHALLAQLLRHEHASLALAQRCSAVAAPLPLFSALLNYRYAGQANATEHSVAWDGIELLGGQERTNYPFGLSVDDFGEGFALTAQAHASVDPGRICGFMATALEQLVDALEGDPEMAVRRISVLSEVERHQVLVEWNATETPYPADRCIHELFEEQVARTLDAVAVVHEDAQLSYGQLNAQANRLAHYLRELGVKPDTRVALCVERSLEMVVGILAVLKAGGAYVPLDPSYPVERLAYMLEDSAPVVVLTHAQAPEAMQEMLAASGVTTVDLCADAQCWADVSESNPERLALTAQHLAYVIYTSGSTGQPKGVMVQHGGLCNLAAVQRKTFAVDGDSRVLQFVSLGFDISVFDLVMSLCHGASLYLAAADTALAGSTLLQTIDRYEITHASLPPAVLNALPTEAKLHSIHTLVIGGEAVTSALVERWGPGRRTFNGYGPTESTVCATLYECDAASEGVPPIGRPIANTRVYIVDQYGDPVPVGVAGELYIGGVGVARGYWNRPELTSQRFVPSPFVKGDRLYKTGDLARYRADGTIEFLGRNDFQVKIRGFRIELGEIEARLVEHEAIGEAVVVAREDEAGEKRLVAYYTLVDAAEVSVETLRAHVAVGLPEYMVPSAYVKLEELPLTPNGKLDRKALPAPDDSAYAVHAYEAPVGETESAIAQIWCELLGLERVGRQDNFFELGGHSLLAVRVIERMRRGGLHADVRALFTAPTLAALANAVGGESTLVEVPPNAIVDGCERITPEMLPLVQLTPEQIEGIVDAVPGGALNIADIYPLAPLQEGILFHHLLAKDGDPYVLRTMLRFESRARVDAFVLALQAVIARHDILRTAVLWEGLSEPVQVVLRTALLVVEEVALDPSAGEVSQQLASRFDPRHYRLDVRQAPLLRVAIAPEVRPGHWSMALLLHHLVCDHTTLEIVLQEVEAHLTGRAAQLPVPLPFRNVVAQARLGVSRAEHEAFFTELLGDVDEPTVPFGLREVHGDGSEIAEARRALDPALAQRLRARARALGVSAASICHLAWARVLGAVSGREDVVFGTVVFGRMQGGEGADRVLGLFINTLPVRIAVGDAGVQESVRQTHALLAQLLRHEHASLALAQRCSAVAAPLPLFSALLNYRYAGQANATGHSAAWDGIELLGGQERTNYPFGLSVDDFGEGFALTAKVHASVDPDRICGFMATALEQLVDALERAPEMAVRRISVLSEVERHQVLVEWNATETPYPADRCIHELFEEQVARTLDAVAVVHEDVQLSYGQLNAQANRLAHYLRELGVKPDTRVALCVERSLEMVVGILAVLKAGGAYVPLDPSYPVERLAYMLEDSAPVVVLTHAQAPEAMQEMLAASGVTTVDLCADAWCWADVSDSNPERLALTAQHLAYVIYTSGSTGQPKGVMVEHRAVVNFLQWMQETAEAGSCDVVLQKTPFTFDASVREIFYALVKGATLVMAGAQGHKDAGHLTKLIQDHEITTLSFVPSMLQAILKRNAGIKLSRVKRVFCGGEVLPVSLAQGFRERLPQAELYNLYGPTEATVDATAWICTDRRLPNTIPIGRPIANMRVYIVDQYGDPVPVGVAGELYIGGVGVARGYWNRPELTAERFVASPFVAGDRLYKTGDLARYRADGTIEFLGRNDFQVKIRGFRIELGEIEAMLRRHGAIGEAVVVAREDVLGEKRLVAYYTTVDDAEVSVEALRAHVAVGLPEYMVPSAYVKLEELPLTPNGKLDRKALPAPDDSAYAVRAYEAPVGETESAIAQIWCELLGLERVGRQDNFFELGGHSLLAVRVLSRVVQLRGVEVKLSELFAYPVLRDFAAVVAKSTRVALPALTVVSRAEPLALSFAQQRLWFLAQLDGVSQAYHMPLGLRLQGELDREALHWALDRIVSRHEVLRTTFEVVEGEPVQRIGDGQGGLLLLEHDLRGHADARAVLERLAMQEAQAPFDLAAGPLIRGRLIALGVTEHVLLLTMHHIISDGWSMGVLVGELSALYAAYREGRADGLPELSIQYADYAAWQRRWLTGEALAEQVSYWQRTLADAPALLELPTDRARLAIHDHAGARIDLELDAVLTAGLKALSRRHGSTLFMTLLSAWGALLSRLSGQQEVVVGTPVANRTHSEIEELIGFFVNTLVLRLDYGSGPTVSQVLERVKTQTLQAQQHQDLPFEQVVELVNPPRSLAHTPLFQVMFAWQNNEIGELALPGLQVAPFDTHYGVAKFDLSLSLGEADGRIVGGLEYATALFDRGTVERYVGYLRTLLAAMVADEKQSIDRVTLLSEQERHQVVEGWNATETPYPADRCIHELFEEQVARTPDAVAVVHEGVQLSYGQLNAQANGLAHYLRELGVKPDTRVALCVERSLEMVVGIMAVLKAGGAYVPLDPSYPVERLAYMLEDSAPVLALTHSAVPTSVQEMLAASGVATVDLCADAQRWADVSESNPERLALTAQHLAYVIYTSGSTGQPKGVMVQHGGLCNLAAVQRKTFAVDGDSRVLQFVSLGFDISVFDLVMSLCHGASLYLAAADTALAGSTLLQTIDRYEITHASLPPAVLNALPTEAKLHSIHTLVIGGEAVTSALVERWGPGRRTFNGYGPTESTVCATLYECDAASEGVPPIGRPIANTRVYIVDQYGDPVPVGVAGELYIGGVGVARGYWNRPELTSQRFVPSPFVAGDRLYKTGDLARYRADGTIEFLGRNDFQVKIRGFRIELGEIEARLVEHEAIGEAVVVAREDEAGEKRLVAYYTLVDDAEVSVETLRAHVAVGLPEYMVPSAYVKLEELPLTPNGKLDRKALPAPDDSAYGVHAYEAPVGETESAIAQIWCELLGLERVGRQDNFFELGGHSLLAVRVIERMRRGGLNADVRALFTAPTLAALANAVGGESTLVEVPPNAIVDGCERITPEMLPLVQLTPEQIEGIVDAVPGGALNIADIYPLAPLQEGILFHHLLAKDGDPYVLRTMLRFESRARVDAFVLALQAVIARHDILRTAVLWEGLSEPVQVVLRTALLVVEEVALDPSAGEVSQQLASRFDPRHYRLDVRQAPLLRVAIAPEVRPGHWSMALLLHHLVCDHTTLEIVLQEVEAHLTGRAAQLPVPLPFRNVVAQARLGVSRAEHEAFFTELLGDVDEPTVPFGLREVHGDGSEIAEARRALDPALAQRLRARARALGVSAASICHLAWARVLGAVSGREDVVFGTVVFGRMQGGEGADRVLGLFINTLPVRIAVGDAGVQESVRQTHALLAQLLHHEHASLALAQRCSAVAAPLPLFSALLNYRYAGQANATEHSAAWDGIELLGGQERTNYPFGLSVDDFGEGFALTAQAHASVDPDRICGFMATALERLVDALERAPEMAVRRISVLSEVERHQVVEGWNATETPYPADRCIHELFEEQVARTPDAVAVVHEDVQLSYGQLNAQANGLAHYLRELGVKPDTRVALCVERSLEMVVGILAVLKAGGAYVPLDPSYPVERLAYMLEDSAPVLALTHSAVPTSVQEMLAASGVATVDLCADAQRWADVSESNPERLALTAQHLAYVIYTSGSTGQPKGVMVQHGGLCNLAAVQRKTFAVDGDSRVLQFVSLGFDISVFDMVMSLCNGASLYLAAAGTGAAVQTLSQTIDHYGITHAGLPPTVLDALPSAATLPSVRTIGVGGEALSQALVERWGPGRRMFNGYGPTESTVCATLYECDVASEGVPPIGRPIANMRVYIVDQYGDPVPVGVAGELYIGGVGVARGYWNRPELTAERFVASPFVAGDRLYKTGDLARYRADGTIEFLGRNDFQVKIRGFRIELGEIEAMLRRHGAIGEAVVVAREDVLGEKRLVAYYTTVDDAEVSVEALRAHVAVGLPEYMVPSAYVKLEELPLTPNGKLDRKALPAPDDSAYAVRAYEAPVGETESAIAQIWCELLGLERVGRQDNFFELGGYSLLAVRVLSRVVQLRGVEVKLSELFAYPVLRDFAAVVAKSTRVALPALTVVSRAEPLALSFAQQRLWFLAQLDGVSQAYHMPLGLRLQGELDREALHWALDRIVSRHEVLRTTFEVVEGEPVQRIGDGQGGLLLLEHDLRGHADARAVLERLAMQEAQAPFDLAAGPLIRGRLIALGVTEHVLLLTMHHIISDGWSMGVLVGELSALYAAYREGRADGLPELSIQYADYAAWQRRWLTGEALAEQVSYWQRTLADAPALLELPTDRARLAIHDHAGARIDLELDAVLTAGLKALSRRHGSTLFMTLLSAWGALLSRLSGQQEVVVGTPVANRTHSEIEELIGFFVNTLVLRLDYGSGPTVSQVLERVKTQTLQAQQHQDLPFEQVVELVNPPRSLAHTPLFQVMFAWQNNEIGELALPGLQVAPFDTHYGVAKFDLSLSLGEADGRIVGGLEYATALFDRGTVERYVGYLRTLLAAMVADEKQRIDRVALLSEQERHQVVEGWNATETPYPADRCIHELFEEQVARTPDAVAVVHEGVQLSYGQLNAQANGLAHYLRELGVKPDTRVALCVERSLEMVVGIMAVLKAGGAYVPLDPSYPVERLAYMLEDSAPVVVLTHAQAPEAMQEMLAASGVTTVDLCADAWCWADVSDSNPERLALTAQHLAYVIYTSGSTGQPKGVMNDHRALANRLHWMQAAYQLGADETVLQKTSLSFDVSVWEVFWPLLCGAKLVLARAQGHKDPDYLTRIIQERGITTVHFVPSMLQVLLGHEAAGQCSSLKRVICSGEALNGTLARRFRERLPQAELHNLYGPTEAAIDVMAWSCADDELPDAIPIGRPIANTRIYLLDPHGEPVPVGVAGELYIGGVQVARGYWNRPELTSQRFVPSPFVEGERLYKTGDLARYRADGTIEFLGRNDFQVKIRGFRIELGEIEAMLRRHGAIGEAVVVAREDVAGEKRLVAYYTLVDDAEVSVEALRAHLRLVLPEYMLPAAYVMLTALPLTPNGKLDRKALPAPDDAAYAVHAYEAPVGETESAIAQIWCELLGLERVGRQDNFFELGGHSLLVPRLISTMKRSGIEISATDVFKNPTITSLAACGVREEPHGPAGIIGIRTSGWREPLFLIHEVSGLDLYFPVLAAHIDPSIPVYGLPGVPLHEAQYQTMEGLASRLVRIIRASKPSGPYRIAGWCWGGSLAYEVATQLVSQEQQVDFLALLDAHHPVLCSSANKAFGGHTPKEALFLMFRAKHTPGTWQRTVLDDLETMADELRLEDILVQCREQAIVPFEYAGFSNLELQQFVVRYATHQQARAGYVPQPISIPVSLFAAKEPFPEMPLPADGLLGWGSTLSEDQIRLVHVPGTHYSMMKADVGALGAALSDALLECDRQRSFDLEFTA